MSLSEHIENKRKDILILVEGGRQGLNDTTLTAEDQYSSNFSGANGKLCFNLH